MTYGSVDDSMYLFLIIFFRHVLSDVRQQILKINKVSRYLPTFFFQESGRELLLHYFLPDPSFIE